jgi:hypothetical protein
MAELVLALLDGVSRVWDWTGVYEGPPRYTFQNGKTPISFDNQVAASIHHDWVMVGGDMRKAMESTGRSAVGQR